MSNFLAFEINVSSRLEFDSVALPFADRPHLGLALKRRGKRVTANHILQSAWTRNLAAIQNNTDRLTETDLDAVLEEAYVPGFKLKNPGLLNWFTETDTWWFENVLRNLEKFDSPYVFSIAASLAMDVGDYVLSFDDSNRELRQPLSAVYRRLWKNLPSPINNSQNNSCQNKTANEFLAESFVDLLYLQVPSGRVIFDPKMRWREEWIRGGTDFWPAIDAAQSGKLGSGMQTRSQMLRSIEETLSIASNIKHWAIEHFEGGLVTTQDVIEIVNKLRTVDKIYTKDFSELTGIKASIITA
jgi:hypothetical protein